jgi:uncharacterized metal-binding protein YceD (DUF177 family)
LTLVDLHRLDLRPGDVHRTRVRLRLEPLGFGGQTYTLEPADIEAAVEVQRAAGGRYFTLEDARVPVAVEASEYHADRPEAGSEEELASEYVEDDRLDVGRWAHDSLVFALPDKLLCSAECRGLCARCGERLSPDVEHACAEPEPDARWAKLRELL